MPELVAGRPGAAIACCSPCLWQGAAAAGGTGGAGVQEEVVLAMRRADLMAPYRSKACVLHRRRPVSELQKVNHWQVRW